jgi:5,10-methylenetetrahydromethanopterin reductase
VRRLASPRLILRSGRQFLPLGQAAVALASTKSIVIGMGILPAGARNVAFAALEIAFLANLYPERLMVGIGHGMADWMRQVGAHPGSPLTLLQEYLQALRALLAGETVSFSGQYVQLSKVRLDEFADELTALSRESAGPEESPSAFGRSGSTS